MDFELSQDHKVLQAAVAISSRKRSSRLPSKSTRSIRFLPAGQKNERNGLHGKLFSRGIRRRRPGRALATSLWWKRSPRLVVRAAF